MSDASAQIALFLPENRTAFQPGEKVAVSILWALDQLPQLLEVRLFWFTRGKGTEDVGVIDARPIPDAPMAGECALSFTLPAAPWSFSGRLISLIWAFELLAEPGGHCVRTEFALGPGGRETLLYPPTDAFRA